MGKTQHGKDKMYVTASEQAALTGPRTQVERKKSRLPFDHCCLSLTPWANPVMTPDGSVFELTQLVPFLRKYKINPVTGEPLSGKDVVKLHWHKNAGGQHACPVTGRVFNEHSRIAVVRTTGNVYSWEAIQELCVARKSYRDLLTDAPCAREDVIVIADPANPEWVKAHTTDSFYHVRGLAKEGAAGGGAAPASGSGGAGHSAAGAAPASTPAAPSLPVAGPSGPVVRLDESSRRVLAEVAAREAAAGPEAWRSLGFTPSAAIGAAAGQADGAPGAAHVTGYGVKTSGAYSGSFTSTGMTPVTRNVAAPVTPADARAARQKAVAALGKKAYVRLTTTLGDLNLELHADQAPATCDNFLTLVRRGYYTGTSFHRSIKNFMIQGGDPTGTGTGGECAWGGRFGDEFHPKLTHAARGVLSMANAGPGTNGSQFFITYRPTPHLDRKHSVFGRVVGGLDTTLRAMEEVPTDPASDRPRTRIEISAVTVFADPFEEYDAKAGAASSSGSGAGAAASVKGSAIVGAGASLAARTEAGTAPVARGGTAVTAAEAAASSAAAAAARADTWLSDPAPRGAAAAGAAGDTYLPRAGSGKGGLVLPRPSDGSATLLEAAATTGSASSSGSTALPAAAAAPAVGSLLRQKLGGGGLGLGVYGAAGAAGVAPVQLSAETLAAMGVTLPAGGGAGEADAAPPPAKRAKLSGGAFGDFSGW